MHFSTCRGTPAEVELSVFHYTGRPSRLVWSVTEMTMTMIKCACGRENPADTIFCFCGRQVAPPPAPKLDGPSEEDLQKLQERVEQLQRDLLIKDKEMAVSLEQQARRTRLRRNSRPSIPSYRTFSSNWTRRTPNYKNH